MIIFYASGHNNLTNAVELPVRAQWNTPPTFEKEPDALGIPQPIGTGSATIEYTFIEPDDLVTLLNTLGITLTSAGANCTILAPDENEVYRSYNAVINLSELEKDQELGVYTDVTFDLTRMVAL